VTTQQAVGVVRGLGVALGLFLASFALHIVGGATDQSWLFAIAVALIFVTATGFPVIAMWASGLGELQSLAARIVGGVGAAAGFGFTVAALWAANGRAFAWWEFPLGSVLVLLGSGALLAVWLFAASHTSASPTPGDRNSGISDVTAKP
jgi:hypothetical protein